MHDHMVNDDRCCSVSHDGQVPKGWVPSLIVNFGNYVDFNEYITDCGETQLYQQERNTNTCWIDFIKCQETSWML